MSDKWNILFEDEDIIVVHKQAGIATESANIAATDLVTELKKYLKQTSTGSKVNKSRGYIAVIHRLDQPVEGILVFAKNKEAAAFLSKQFSSKTGDIINAKNELNTRNKLNTRNELNTKDGLNSKNKLTEKNNFKAQKTYKALIYGHLPANQGTLDDLMYKDAKDNKSYILDVKSKTNENAKTNPSLKINEDAKTNSNLKRAILNYRRLEQNENTELVEIFLKTGRYHQIRSQFANINCPIVGDLKYGNELSIEYSKSQGFNNICLKAYKLSFIHPKTKKIMKFELK